MNKSYIVIILAVALATFSVSAIPQVGQTGFDHTYVNTWDGQYAGTNDNPWKVCRADESTAWVSADNAGVFDAVSVCQQLGYSDVNAIGGTCGTVCGFCSSPGQEVYDGAGGSATELQYTVNWRCTNYVGVADGNSVPEFGMAGIAVILAGAVIFVWRKNNE